MFARVEAVNLMNVMELVRNSKETLITEIMKFKKLSALAQNSHSKYACVLSVLMKEKQSRRRRGFLKFTAFMKALKLFSEIPCQCK